MAKLTSIYQRLRSRPKPFRLVVVVCLGLLLVVVLIYILTSDSRKQSKVTSLNTSASTQKVDGDYVSAAENYKKAYNTAPNPQSKADSAANVAGAYESAIDYQKALQWYKTAFTEYTALKDESGVSDSQDSILRVSKYLTEAIL